MSSKRSTEFWTLRAKSFSISILNDYHDYPGKWVMHAFIFKIDTKILNASSAEEAKEESIGIVRAVVKKYVDDIMKIDGEEPGHQELNGG
jgi:hypothetical protein